MRQPAENRVHRRTVLQAAAALCCGRFLHAQDQPVFSAGVKVVNILATVRNKAGELVASLSKEDFSLSEDGRPQTIRYFTRETDLPLTVGLMVDTSGSQQRVLDAERGASFRFLDQVVRENKDKVFIVQFDSAVQIRQDLTSSVRKLEDVLAYVDTETERQLQIQHGGGTLLYDAVVRASKDIMQKQSGRKALIVLTDGVDNGSYFTLQDAVDAAQRADTLVYSILYADAGAYGMFGGGGGERVLRRMSEQTGGGYFEVTKKLTVDRIFDTIEQELRSQYNIGYISDKPAVLSEFRAVQLTAQKGLAVQARREYWARP
jgi:VWFA-related protein